MSETVFEIGGQQFDVIKKGLKQANQVAEIGRWLAVHGAPAYRATQQTGDNAGGIEQVAAALATLSGDALMELYVTVFGCPYDLAEEEFDLNQLIDGIVALYENSPIVKRLVSRFFSGNNSQPSEAANSTN